MAEQDMWTVQAALDWTQGYLARKGDENPRLSAQWLLAEATGMRRIELYAHFDRPLSMEERGILRDYVARRGAGEPLQYITGEVGFRHIAVKVRAGVLIPRPETEVLVSEGLALLPEAPRPRASESFEHVGDEAASSDDGANEASSVHVDETADAAEDLIVADLCTGSGCIACSIAFEHPCAHVVATDLSPEAIALARENVAALELDDRVDVLQCDLGAGIDSALLGCFDLVISNPPYIPTDVLAELPVEVTGFEPGLALDGGLDGLDLYRRALAWCAMALKPQGGFAFELHETCLDAAADEARAAGFSDVRIVDDLAGRPRVLVGRLSLDEQG